MVIHRSAHFAYIPHPHGVASPYSQTAAPHCPFQTMSTGMPSQNDDYSPSHLVVKLPNGAPYNDILAFFFSRRMTDVFFVNDLIFGDEAAVYRSARQRSGDEEKREPERVTLPAATPGTSRKRDSDMCAPQPPVKQPRPTPSPDIMFESLQPRSIKEELVEINDDSDSSISHNAFAPGPSLEAMFAPRPPMPCPSFAASSSHSVDPSTPAQQPPQHVVCGRCGDKIRNSKENRTIEHHALTHMPKTHARFGCQMCSYVSHRRDCLLVHAGSAHGVRGEMALDMIRIIQLTPQQEAEIDGNWDVCFPGHRAQCTKRRKYRTF